MQCQHGEAISSFNKDMHHSAPSLKDILSKADQLYVKVLKLPVRSNRFYYIIYTFLIIIPFSAMLLGGGIIIMTGDISPPCLIRIAKISWMIPSLKNSHHRKIKDDFLPSLQGRKLPRKVFVCLHNLHQSQA